MAILDCIPTNSVRGFPFRRYGLYPWVGNIPWRSKWQPTLVFLLEKSHGQRSLVGYSPWDQNRAVHDLVTKRQQRERPYCTVKQFPFPNPLHNLSFYLIHSSYSHPALCLVGIPCSLNYWIGQKVCLSFPERAFWLSQ